MSEALDDSLKNLSDVEAGLNSLIERRARQAKAAKSVEDLWARSVREDRKKRGLENAQSWYDYHDRLIKSHEDTLGSLVSYHQKERARYAQILGISEITPVEEKGN